MSLSIEVLFGRPQSEIASLLARKLSTSTATSIVTGFATADGLDSISKPIRDKPQVVRAFVVGAGTYKAYAALDDLLRAGVPADRLFVHLGHTKASTGRKNPFVRYHPMMHSKVYYTEQPGGNAAAFIGSHNVTSFALTGKNGEASVLIEGPASSPQFREIRRHIDAARAQSVQYQPGMNEAYAWWTAEYFDGLQQEARDGVPKDTEGGRMILVFTTIEPGKRVSNGEVVYLEIPDAIQQIESMKTPAHLFVFDRLPRTPWDALAQAHTARSYSCMTIGLNTASARELDAHWHIDNHQQPVLKATRGGHFRPSQRRGWQQVQIEVRDESVPAYQHFFEKAQSRWEPVFDAKALPPPGALPALAAGFDEIDRGDLVRDPMDDGWQLVTALRARDESLGKVEAAALYQVSPESGSFIMVSLRRRRRME